MTDEEINELISESLTINARACLDFFELKLHMGQVRRLVRLAIAAEREAITEHVRHLAAHGHALFIEVEAKGDPINTAHATGMTEAYSGVLHAIRKRGT